MDNHKVLCVRENELVLKKTNDDLAIIKPTEVVIRTMYSHISAGTELACIAGKESFFSIPGTPGYTSIGEVIQRGDDVPLDMGDLIFTFGSHAEFFKFDMDDRWHGNWAILPEGINPEHAAFTHMAGIAMTALRKSSIELGDLVLITGLGTIGNLAAQLVQLQGGYVLATEINSRRRSIARECGISQVADPSSPDFDQMVEKFTQNKGFSTFIDATGSAKVIQNYLKYVSLYGEVVLLGSPRSAFESNLTEMLQKFHLLPYSLTLKGALEFTFPTHPTEFVKHSLQRNSEIILDLIRNQVLNIAPLHTHTLSPHQAQEAYDGLRESPEEYQGVLFDWSRL